MVTSDIYIMSQKILNRFSLNVILGVCIAALGGLVVSVLATGPTGCSVAGSNPTKDSGFLWVIKIPSMHFLPRGSKARSHVIDLRHVKEPY
jgi:hypothetical protein